MTGREFWGMVLGGIFVAACCVYLIAGTGPLLVFADALDAAADFAAYCARLGWSYVS